MTDIELAERVEQLQRDARRLRGIFVASLVVIGVLGAIYAAQPVPEKITALAFQAIGGEGRIRAVMTAGCGFGPELVLNDAQGNPRAAISVDSCG